MRFSQIKGVGVGLGSQISFHPPLKRFDCLMFRFIECAIYMCSLYVDSSHGNPR